MITIAASGGAEAERMRATAFAEADQACAFGPSFFLGHLRRFVRDHCPDPGEHLPVVQIRLADGETLDLCHVIGVAPRWAMLAVRDGDSRSGMAVALVPFEVVRGVMIRTRQVKAGAVGFEQAGAPAVITAETLLVSAMPPAPLGGA